MDISYLLLLQRIREALGGAFNDTVLTFTSLGSQLSVLVLIAVFYWCIDKNKGVRMALSFSLAGPAYQVIKNIFKIQRPWLIDSRIHPVEKALEDAGGYSFPSGHVSRVASTYGSLGVNYWKDEAEKNAGANNNSDINSNKNVGADNNSENSKVSTTILNKIICIICIMVVAIVAISRNYLGVHTAKDVLVALVLGAISIVVSNIVVTLSDKKKNADTIVLLAFLFVILLPMLRVGCISNAGLGMGLVIGWFIERRFIQFSTDIKPTSKVFRLLTGIIGILLITQVFNNILLFWLTGKYAGFFSQFINALFIMAIYPWMFKLADKTYKTRFPVALIALASILIFSFILAVLAYYGREHEKALARQRVLEEQQYEVQNTDNLLDMSYKTPLLISHRGYSSVYPENTMSAFAGALDIGADYIELDVQITKDGQIVVFHDDYLKRITGMEGMIADYTYDELCNFDAGSWKDQAYSFERIPLLSDVLQLVKTNNSDNTLANHTKVYLEIKNISMTAPCVIERDENGLDSSEITNYENAFVKAVYDEVSKAEMLDDVVFASFVYPYMAEVKRINEEQPIIYIASYIDENLFNNYPAEYYGLERSLITKSVVDSIHEYGSEIFVWTVDNPMEMREYCLLGVDGIITNCSGLCKTIMQEESKAITGLYVGAVPLPGLYEIPDDDIYDIYNLLNANAGKYINGINVNDYVVQGLTVTNEGLAISAYSKSGETNSILYLTDFAGKLDSVIDLGFKAHTGGLSYDADNNLLWITGPDGMVYSIDWTEIEKKKLDATHEITIKYSFDAELVNHTGSKVASFLTYNNGYLYVGSYVDMGGNGYANIDTNESVTGLLNRYKIASGIPEFEKQVVIPERIQGVTFADDGQNEYMYLSQGYQTDNSHLLKFEYSLDTDDYTTPILSLVMPEGMEQIQNISNSYMFVLFESAARPYRATARHVNDQIFLIHLP